MASSMQELSRCVSVDPRAVRKFVRERMVGLRGDADHVAEKYGLKSQRDRLASKHASRCARYVVERVRADAARLVVTAMSDYWLVGASADELIEGLVSGTYQYSQAAQEGCDRIRESGSALQKKRLAAYFRSQQAGIRRGPPKAELKVSQLRWVRKNLPRIRQSVSEACRSEDRDHRGLVRFLKEEMPSTAAVGLREVRQAYRAGHARELIVGAKFKVGRVVAARLIAAAKKS